MTSTQRVQRHRRREADGRAIYQLTLDFAALELMLTDAGFLSPICEGTHADTQAALQKMIDTAFGEYDG